MRKQLRQCTVASFARDSELDETELVFLLLGIEDSMHQPKKGDFGQG